MHSAGQEAAVHWLHAFKHLDIGRPPGATACIGLAFFFHVAHT